MILKRGIIFIFTVACCDAFRPNRFSGIETDYSHESITDTALHLAAAEYIAKYLQPGVYNGSDFNVLRIIKDFFHGDVTSLHDFGDVVKLIIYGNNNAQRHYDRNAMYTMNAEQIMEGNLKLQSKRQTIIKLAKSGQPDWHFIRTAVGEYMMTLQMFYSNTNWIEKYGQNINVDLGIRGQKIQPVATADMATCTDCNYTLSALENRSCSNNVIDNGDYLTSGYRSLQDITKPQGIWANNVGKCSHGGIFDSTRSIPARGGINKETSNPRLSPHFYLHKQAGEAAIEATVHFLIGARTGLLNVFGAELFGDFLNIYTTCYSCLDPKLSLTFVIDTTGSMGNDIFAVRQKAIDIVNKASSGGGTANYVLATFNDPVKSTVQVTTNGETMKLWLNSLIAKGGGDCPEYAMSGLLAGINASLPGSCLFFFTDADPKDPNLESQVISEANRKDIHLMMFLRGQCSGQLVADNTTNPKCIPKKNNLNGGRQKRSLSSWGMFSHLISATSAAAIKVPAGAITKTIGDVIDSSMDINPIYIANFTMNNTMKSYSFPIDSYIRLFTVEVSGENSKTNINLIRPDGITQSYTNGSATRDDIGEHTVVLSVTKPTNGIWVLKKTGRNQWKVNIEGQGVVDFTSSLMEDVEGERYPISGLSPIAGSNMSIGVAVNGVDENSTVEEVVLRSESDTSIITLQVNDTKHSSPRLLLADFEIPYQPFRVTIKGTDGSGYTFRRTSQDIITPVTGNLEILPVINDLVKGKSSPVYFKVTNAGFSRVDFTVIAKDTQNYLQNPTKNIFTINPKETLTSSFNLTGGKELSITLLTIQLKRGLKTLQSKKVYLMVAETVPPSFEIIKRSPDCAEIVMNSVNCSFGDWWIETSIDFSQPSTKLFLPSVPDSVVLIHSPLNETGLVSANISGDCCTAMSKLVAIDSASNVEELPLDFTGGLEFTHIITKVKHYRSPIIKIISNSKNCTSEFMNSENCTYDKWWAIATATFDSAGTALYISRQTLGNGNSSNIVIQHEDLKSLKKVISVNVSGLCCTFNTTLIANDSSGLSSRQNLDFSGGLNFQRFGSNINIAEKPKELKSPQFPMWAIIVAVIGAIVLVIIGISIAMLILKKRKSHQLQKQIHVSYDVKDTQY